MLRLLLILCLSPSTVIAIEPSAIVDSSTLTGKVMCGYQGWFNCPGDGANIDWKHWVKQRGKPFRPGNASVDLWPDLTEFTAEEKFATGYKHADGRVAEVFSSARRPTVLRHFQWMQEHGIDGVFLQRFVASHSNAKLLSNQNNVLSHVRAGATASGRAFAVMYDLSGSKAGQVKRVRQDWERLQDTKITANTTYLHHKGHPVVAVWGVGFSDDRDYELQECLELVRWLKESGCTVMLGVPSYWRAGTRDAVDDPLLHRILEQADIVSPWSVGRYQNSQQAKRHASQTWSPDLAWCRQRKLDFLPVVFPGFSWHNLHGDELNAIPRDKGRFLWSQLFAAQNIGCSMIYIAMFDEVDEATAIFKCTNDPPVGPNAKFLTYEGLPSDYYLKLVGHAAKTLRGEVELTEDLPTPSN